MHPDLEKAEDGSDPETVEGSKAEPQNIASEDEPHDQYLVDFNENDARNPLDWSSAKKSLNIAVLSAYTFVTQVLPSTMAVLLEELTFLVR